MRPNLALIAALFPVLMTGQSFALTPEGMNADTSSGKSEASAMKAQQTSLFTLQERDAERFSKQAMTSLMTHGFHDSEKTLDAVRGIFATETDYQNFLNSIDYSISWLQDEKRTMAPSEISVDTVVRDPEQEDLWVVSGLVEMKYYTAATTDSEMMKFRLTVQESDTGSTPDYGVKVLTMGRP